MKESRPKVLIVDQERPPLIILDMYMPGMNGIGVLRHLYERKTPAGSFF